MTEALRQPEPAARKARWPTRPSFGWALVVEIAFGGLGFLLAWVCGFGLLDQFRGSLRSWLVALVAVLPLLGLYVLVRRSSWPFLRELTRLLEREIRPMFETWSWWQLVLVAMAAGAGEELLFRGFFQTWGAIGGGVWGGVALASLLFGLAHPISFAYGAVVALIGAYLGWLKLWTNDLGVPMIVHALYDGIVLQWLVRGFPRMGPAESARGERAAESAAL